MKQAIHIITGGGTGIGAAAASALAQQGQRVLITGRRPQPLQAVAKQHPDQIAMLAMDVAQAESPVRLLGWLERHQLRAASVVHNAAILDPVARLGGVSIDAWQQHMAINLTAPLNLTQHLLANLRPGGRQLFVSSGAAHAPIEGWAAYCASKAALHMLMRQFASEFQPAELATADLRPGVVDTPMQAAIRGSRAEDFPAVERFRELKENDELVNPDDVGCMIAGLLTRHDNADFHGESWDMRNPEHLSRWTGS